MENRDYPQNEHYIPPVSGAIRWARLILNTVKYSIVRFLHSQPELFEEGEEAEADADIEEEMSQNQGAGDQGDQERDEAEVGRKRGQNVRQQYIELAHKLRDFEMEKFRGWESDIVTSLNARLSQSILFKNPAVVPFHKVRKWNSVLCEMTSVVTDIITLLGSSEYQTATYMVGRGSTS